MQLILTKHAQSQMMERGISIVEVMEVYESPDKVINEDGKRIYQKVMIKGDNKYLTRVFVIKDGPKNKILTVYRTSKIEKYL